MKAVAIPVIQGHSTVAVFPQTSNGDDKVTNTIRGKIHNDSFQGMSFVYLNCREQFLPKFTGQFMFLEFKPSYDYCLLPSYATNQGTLLSYPEKPSFIDLFDYSHHLAEVCL